MKSTAALMLYTTLGCQLCEELEAWLARLAPQAPALQRVEIADDPALFARYGERIPVLRDAAGGELERGFEPERLAAWLDGRGWLDHDAWARAQGEARADSAEPGGAVIRGGRRYLGGPKGHEVDAGSSSEEA